MTGVSNLFYRQFPLKKRSGGIRTIESPYPKLAYVQRWIKNHILEIKPISSNALAYVQGSSHIENAKRHIGAKELLKIDLVDFFEYIKLSTVKSIFTECGYTEKVSHQLAKLCTLRDRLPQGAPSSPVISNLVLVELDKRLQSISKKHELVYTRYADDLCFSGHAISDEFFSLVKDEIESEGFVVNQNKSGVVRGHKRKLITGLVVSEYGVRVPKKMRREYRKQAHYMLKNGIEQLNGNMGMLNPLHIDEVIGKGQYILSVEPGNAYVKDSLCMLLKLKNKLLIK
ncbi:RNA-directed DNA polymerase (Reverse transcriptase) [Shewanella halifaxensis HAW-EB4]|uniref:RNA-directed DNA polymerase n=2 Tax=Shewanella halifaxensis TaxID=271098 RepID=B0TRB7_SHEHH|nr:RNA-directed DNA polymerase (Reverse transcriptase) [Shewanella halifaxensis HAW-EB4]